jgi:pimeloyl-ACP methyl ester carboxylesterase
MAEPLIDEALRSIAVDGTVRFFEEHGRGPMVVLVHGSASSSRQWRKLTDRLRHRYRLVAPDLSACQAPGPADFSIAQDCDLVAQLIAMTGGKAHLVGHSYGGIVAVMSALKRPESVSTLTLIEPSCFHLLAQAARQAEDAEIKALRDAQQRSFASGDLEASARLFIDYWMGPAAWSSMPERRKGLILKDLRKLTHDWLGAFENTTMLSDYRSLSMPSLLIRAKDTRMPSACLVDLIGKELPHHARIDIEHGGHMSPITNPDAVNTAIETFLDRH